MREGGEYNLSAFSVGELISPANLELIGDNRHHFEVTWERPASLYSKDQMGEEVLAKIHRVLQTKGGLLTMCHTD